MTVGPDPERFAELLCEWCMEVREGDQVLVGTTPQSMPLVVAVHRALLERRAWPLIRLMPSELSEDFYLHATDIHLDSFAPLELVEAQALDARLVIQAPTNTRALASVDPVLIARSARARAPVREALLRPGMRWCGTLWPTAALAQQAAMSERDYSAFVTRALFLDQRDPIAAWRRLSERQAQLVARLSSGREIRLQAPGTDLRLRVDGRTWINSDGRRNMPSGEVFTGPLESSATGHVRFTVPSSPGGVEVTGVELTFADGEVIDARADRGEDYLEAALATDAGARRLGELGIGTNSGIDRATGSILLDEKMSGTVHLALGRSYPETGGTNASSLHWDLICDLRADGSLTVDGELLEITGR
jgi:aminopeptidase